MRKILTQAEVSAIETAYPGIPQDYLEYMKSVGWGECDSGHMIYRGPTSPQEIFGLYFEKNSVVLLGDDFQGYFLGFDLLNKRYGEVTPKGEWQPGEEESDLYTYIS